MTPEQRQHVDDVLARTDLVAVIAGAGVKLGRGTKPRGQCPFHGSKSDSFAVYPDKGYAHCWGCGWSGDAIKFLREFYDLSFPDALARLTGNAGVGELAARPKAYVKRENRRRDAPHVDSRTMARFIWAGATHRPDAVRTYFLGRGVPAAVLTDERLRDVRFHALAPLSTWPEDRDGPLPDAEKAPAICALIRRPIADSFGVKFVPVGLHVTFLAPDLGSKMVRRRRDGREWPDRKMLGDSGGGCVLLGARSEFPGLRMVTIDHSRPLFVGEGLETVFSGMAIAGAPSDAIGLATLSLGNLQGGAVHWRNGVLPLFDIRPDPERPAIAFAHAGPVTGLIDADMKPLRGPLDQRTKVPRGLPVVEARGGPIVRRTITSAERSAICADLVVKSWRAAGTPRVRAMRPRMGQDFNDAIRGTV